MRTTVMFPPDLMRVAKARSAELGESLKTLLTRALTTELGHHMPTRSKPARVALPIFGSAGGPLVTLSNTDLERALADADAAAAAGPRQKATRSRASRRR